jgi:2-C-methyl-D-erythritol 4-phosphate cytidylyltransferase
MPAYAVILPAAGGSRRFRNKNYKKPFVPLGDKAVWLHSAERFLGRDDVKQLVVVIAEEDREAFDRKFSANLAFMGIQVAMGGPERTDSVRNALELIRKEIDLVAIHDAARPCLADAWIDRVFKAAASDGAAVLGVRVADTLKRADRAGLITATVERQGLWAAQTPQVFRRELLCRAYAALEPGAVPESAGPVTDDAQLVERLGEPITMVDGSPLNWKITTAGDLKLAEQILRVLPKSKPSGIAHPFAADDLFR